MNYISFIFNGCFKTIIVLPIETLWENIEGMFLAFREDSLCQNSSQRWTANFPKFFGNWVSDLVMHQFHTLFLYINEH